MKTEGTKQQQKHKTQDQQLPKVKGLGRTGGKGGIRVGKKKGGITISMYKVGGSMGRGVQHREGK